MAETTLDTYQTTSTNTAATTPNLVAVVNDGTGNRQIVVLGAGDGTAALVDGTSAHPLNIINLSSIAGGLTAYTLISAATTNATSVKTTAGTVYSIQASNTGTAVAFLKLYNLAAAPTVGTSVAVKTLIIPAGGGIVASSGDIGIGFNAGIAFAITGVATTSDTTAVAAAQVVANIDFV